MSNDVINLINQAKDQARNENIKNFFGKNSKLLGRLTVITVLAGIIFLGANSLHNSRQAKYSEIFHQSLIDEQLGDSAKARENLQKIYDAKMAPNGVRSLASLRLAALYFNEGNKVEANKIYLEISECDSCDTYIRDLAGLLLVKNWMSDEQEVNKDDLSARVEKVENSNKTLKYYISEQRAFLEAEKGNYKKSYQILELIVKSSESPKVLKDRAADGIKILAAKGFEEESQVKSEEKQQEKN